MKAQPAPATIRDAVPVQPMLIGGEWQASTHLRDVVDPGSGTAIARVPEATPDDVERAIAIAECAAAEARRLPAIRAAACCTRRRPRSRPTRKSSLASSLAKASRRFGKRARKQRDAPSRLRLSAEEAERLTGDTVRFDAYAGGEQRVQVSASAPGILRRCSSAASTRNPVPMRREPCLRTPIGCCSSAARFRRARPASSLPISRGRHARPGAISFMSCTLQA